MNTQSGNVLNFSVGLTEFIWAILIPSFCFFPLLAMKMSVFTSEAHWILPYASLLCVLRALCVTFSTCTSGNSGVCIFLQYHFMISQGNGLTASNSSTLAG